MYQNHRRYGIFLYVLDLLAFALSIGAANAFWLVVIRKYTYLNRTQLFNNIGIMLFTFLLAVFLFNSNQKLLKRNGSEEFIYCVEINLIFAAFCALLLFITGNDLALSRGVYGITVVLNILFMTLFHSLFRKYLKGLWRHKKSTQLFIITSKDRAKEVVERFFNTPDLFMRICAMAVIDADMTGETVEGIPVVAGIDSMIKYVKDEAIDEIFVNIPYRNAHDIHDYIMELENMGAIVHINLDKLETFSDFHQTLNKLGSIPVVTFANNFYEPNKLVIKRVIDIIGSLIGVIITCIASVFLIPAIMIESPGAPIFKQKRVGRNGRYFYLYKFRSMYRDAEERKKALMVQNEMKGLMFKMTDDPRITKVGKFIRKTSLDELPQFFNILKGDMSLVGTRPPTVDEFQQYEGHHKRRLSMKPGLTGMWQVSGRSDIEDFEEVVRLDLQYIDNWTIGLDFKILLRTVVAVLKHGGAR